MLSLIGIPIVVIGLAVTVFGVFVLFARNYQKCAPNEVLVVYGRKRQEEVEGKSVSRGYRLITGGATFVYPLLESFTKIALNVMKLELKIEKSPNKDGVLMSVDAVANIKISSDPTMLSAAVERLLQKEGKDVISLCTITLEGLLRQIIGTLTIEDIVSKRETISHQVLQIATTELNRLGFVIDNFVILKIHDDVGYIEALGKKRTAEVKRDAEIGEAEAKRESTIKASMANQEGEQKRLESEAEIAAAQRDLDIKKARFRTETETAQAEAAMAGEMKKTEISRELRARQVAIDAADVKARTEVAELEISRKEKELQGTVIKPAEATAKAATIKAEGDKSAAIIAAEASAQTAVKEAEATKSKAEAEKVKVTCEGEGAAAAEAAKLRQRGEAEGAATRARGEAEGAAISARLLAEAEGLRKKQEALAQMSPQAQLIIILEQLPKIIEEAGDAGQKMVSAAFEPVGTGLSRIDSLNILDMGNGNGSSPVTKVGMAIPEIVFGVISKFKALGFDVEGICSKLGIDASQLFGGAIAKETEKKTAAGAVESVAS